MTFNNECTAHVLNEIRSLIINDDELERSVIIYFDKFKLSIEHFEKVQNIFRLKSGCEFLHNLNINDFLSKSLMAYESHEYYIKWFKCFLANDQVQDTNTNDECKRLFDIWIGSCQSNYSTFTKVLMAVDELLSANNFWLHSHWINNLVDVCLKQSK